MRIIENNYNAHTEYERDCPRCNSKFAFSFGDSKMDSVTLSHYVECPCCGFSIPLNSKSIEESRNILREYFDKVPSDRFKYSY